MASAVDGGPGREACPETPDGRYFVVRGRLWRKSNPGLDEETRQQLVDELMAARRAVGAAKRAGDQSAEDKAHAEVERTKRALGERGAPWWTDGTTDYNRHLAKNTPYATWYEALKKDGIGENR